MSLVPDYAARQINRFCTKPSKINF